MLETYGVILGLALCFPAFIYPLCLILLDVRGRKIVLNLFIVYTIIIFILDISVLFNTHEVSKEMFNLAVNVYRFVGLPFLIATALSMHFINKTESIFFNASFVFLVWIAKVYNVFFKYAILNRVKIDIAKIKDKELRKRYRDFHHNLYNVGGLILKSSVTEVYPERTWYGTFVTYSALPYSMEMVKLGLVNKVNYFIKQEAKHTNLDSAVRSFLDNYTRDSLII